MSQSSRLRAARAALVHEHEVAPAVDPGEGAENRRVTLDRSLSRPARDEEERVRLRLRRNRRDDSDGKLDVRAFRVVRIFRHGELPAAGFRRAEPVRVRDAAGLERDQRLGVQRLRAEQRAAAERGAERGSETGPVTQVHARHNSGGDASLHKRGRSPIPFDPSGKGDRPLYEVRRPSIIMAPLK